MVLSAGPTGYIVSGLPTPSRATTGRRPLTPRTTTQVRLFKQLLDKQTGALLELPLADTQLAQPNPRMEAGRIAAEALLSAWA